MILNKLLMSDFLISLKLNIRLIPFSLNLQKFGALVLLKIYLLTLGSEMEMNLPTATQEPLQRSRAS